MGSFNTYNKLFEILVVSEWLDEAAETLGADAIVGQIQPD